MVRLFTLTPFVNSALKGFVTAEILLFALSVTLLGIAGAGIIESVGYSLAVVQVGAILVALPVALVLGFSRIRNKLSLAVELDGEKGISPLPRKLARLTFFVFAGLGLLLLQGFAGGFLNSDSPWIALGLLFFATFYIALAEIVRRMTLSPKDNAKDVTMSEEEMGN